MNFFFSFSLPFESSELELCFCFAIVAFPPAFASSEAASSLDALLLSWRFFPFSLALESLE